MLTIGKLKEIIQDLDSDLPVVISHDEEGDFVRYASNVEVSMYKRGKLFLFELTDSFKEQGFDESDVLTTDNGGVKVFSIWP